MAYHESFRQQFIENSALSSSLTPAMLADEVVERSSDIAAYGIRLQPAQVTAGGSYWRLIGVHHLSPDENRGGHAVFVDLVDEAGKGLRHGSYRLRWGWEGQRPTEASPPKAFDKPVNEAATNVDLYLGQLLWVEVDGDGLPSDRVANLHSKHADEPGPHGELWNSIGHHSFYLVFQRTRATTGTGAQPSKPSQPVEIKPPPDGSPKPTKPPVKTPDLNSISHLELLNAFALAAGALGLNDPWTLLKRAGLDVGELAANGWARYTGTPLQDLPNLSAAEKKLILKKLDGVLAMMPSPPLGDAPKPSDDSSAPLDTSPNGAAGDAVKTNKLGFYLHLSTDQDGLWEAIRQVQPPVILIHADSANRMLLREIRAFRAPNAFVIARLYKDNNTQTQLLKSDDPASRGREMADEILALDFGLATERGANGRLLIDAWMSLNEAVAGPASRQFAEKPAETAAMLHAYDLFQCAFHTRLQEAGVESIAFNFAAGNFTRPEHYLDHFPNTLAKVTYLGFHEYGWPTLQPGPDSATGAGFYRACMNGIRARYGARHRVVITEAGLTRIYQNPTAGDVGWLNNEAPLSEENYWQSLHWYNQHLAADDYVTGACLYEVGHHGDWVSFRHLGRDNQGNPLQLMQKIAALNGNARGRGRRRGQTGAAGQRGATRNFVRVQGGEFVADGRPLRFIGVNIRGIVHYGDGHTLPFATADHAREQIRAARAMGARVVRLFLPSVHADTPTTIERLRRLLEIVRAEAPDLYLLPALCNLYQDVEFRIQGDDGFYERIDPHFPGNLLNAAFFNGGYRTNYLPFVQQVVQAFRDEPLIFAWEIGNELKLNPVSGALESDPNVNAFITFMLTLAQEIRRLDSNHLVTTGMISTHHAWLHTPALRQKIYGGKAFDFITVHCYNDERVNDDSDLAQQLGKPFMVEEAGYGQSFGSDRSPKTREDMAIWFSKGSRGYMPWGFMATSNDIGDGDSDSGLDRTLHRDWDALFSLYRGKADALNVEAASIVLPPPAPGDNQDASSHPRIEPIQEPVGAFQANQSVFSADWINIRKSPGYVNKLGDDIVGLCAPDQTLTILGPAVVQDELTWWPVRVVVESGQTVDGWAAEANATMRLLNAQRARGRGAAGLPARPRGHGVRRGRARGPSQLLYATTYVNLRRTPGYVGKGSDDLQGQIPYGAQMLEIGSAVMADNLTWRSVRAPLLDNSVATGWAAEVDPNGVQLLAMEPPPAPVTNVGGVIGATFQPGASLTLLGVTELLPAASSSTKAATPLASLLPNGKVTVVNGPELRGDLEWWQTTQSGSSGDTLSGWAPLTTDDGLRLLAATEVAEALHAGLPFAEAWPITQGWSGNAQIYSTIEYDGVPLKGHNGLDFGTPVGTPLLGIDEGRVLRVDYEEGGFGHFILLQHAWGESLYAHLERSDLLQGANVARGQQLGLSGNSGFSSGPHLHFGIRIYPYRRTDGWGGFVNPMPFLPLQDFVVGRARAFVDRWTPLPGWVRP